MKELYKLIEDYLEGRLSDHLCLELERRMAEDEGLRREVELHRAIQEEFRDPRGWQLFLTIEEIMEEPPSSVPSIKEVPENSRKKWWWLVLFVLVLGTGIWDFQRGEVMPTFVDPTPESPSPSVVKTPQAQDTARSNPPALPQQNPPIAQATAADYKPNASLEGYRGTTRSEEENLSISSPKDSSGVFHPDSKYRTVLRFLGEVETKSMKDTHLRVLIFNNRDTRNPVLTLPIILKPAETETKTRFETSATVALRRGLYYYWIEVVESESLLKCERFYIGKH